MRSIKILNHIITRGVSLTAFKRKAGTVVITNVTSKMFLHSPIKSVLSSHGATGFVPTHVVEKTLSPSMKTLGRVEMQKL